MPKVAPSLFICWLVVKLGTLQDKRPDRSDERSKNSESERTKGVGEMSTLFPLFPTPKPSFIIIIQIQVFKFLSIG
jgi:hypothetical protein